jgi:uncharacterized protein
MIKTMTTTKTPPSASSALFIALILLFALCPVRTIAQTADQRPIVGDWEGTLNPGAQPKKRIVVHITAEQDGTLSGSIDYPDQDTSGIQMTAITYKNPALHFESTPDLSAYDGTISKTNPPSIVGTFKQGGNSLSLTLKHP